MFAHIIISKCVTLKFRKRVTATHTHQDKSQVTQPVDYTLLWCAGLVRCDFSCKSFFLSLILSLLHLNPFLVHHLSISPPPFSLPLSLSVCLSLLPLTPLCVEWVVKGFLSYLGFVLTINRSAMHRRDLRSINAHSHTHTRSSSSSSSSSDETFLPLYFTIWLFSSCRGDSSLMTVEASVGKVKNFQTCKTI